ncbi:unnamed protein product [Caenorhabditis brenneri]
MTADTYAGKTIAFRHVFENISKMNGLSLITSGPQEHFGVQWIIYISRDAENCSMCLEPEIMTTGDEPWWIIADFQVKLIGSNRYYLKERSKRFTNFENNDKFWPLMGWNKLMDDYVNEEDKLTVEVKVRIVKMSGVYKQNLRCFDETKKLFSDLVFEVQDVKFYVAKLYLATHSPYFDTLLLGTFRESKMSEIKLSGIDAADFQNYLEVLYGDHAINETTVEGILHVADMYNTPIVTGKCEKFLWKKSQKCASKLIELSSRYRLETLKTNCISAIEQMDVPQILELTTEDSENWDAEIKDRFEKRLIELGNIYS